MKSDEVVWQATNRFFPVTDKHLHRLLCKVLGKNYMHWTPEWTETHTCIRRLNKENKKKKKCSEKISKLQLTILQVKWGNTKRESGKSA